MAGTMNGHGNGHINKDQLQYTPVDEIAKIHSSVFAEYLKGKTRTYEWRANQLRQVGFMFQENEPLFEKALNSDLGRHRGETHMAELVGMKSETKEALSHLKSWMKPTRVKTTLPYMATWPKIYHEPKGTVLIIGTWNYPITLLFGPAIGAIAGGNSIVLKPAEQCPAVAKLFSELVPKYLDTSAIRVVNGAIDETQELLKQRWDHIFYTGSGRVGKIIAKAAAEHLTPVTLELGGKSPAVVFDDADITTTARRIMWGKTVNAGQTCIAPDYVLCQSHMTDKLVDGFKKALEEFYPGQKNTIDSDNYTNIVNPGMFNRLKTILEETKGQVVMGGDTDSERNKISLTVIKGVNAEDSTMTSEIFGPILPIVTVRDKEEAVKFIQARDQPLALYVFTKSNRNMEYVQNHTRSGQIIFGDTLVQFIIPGLPFGGTGPSGTGNYHGYHSFLAFTHERASATVAPWMDLALASRYPPYTPGKVKLLHMFLGAKFSGHSKPGGGNVTKVGHQSHGLIARLFGTTGTGRVWRVLLLVLMVLSTRQGSTKL